MRVAHVIEAMHTGGAESLLLEHVRCAGPGVETTLVALNRGGPALERRARWVPTSWWCDPRGGPRCSTG